MYFKKSIVLHWHRVFISIFYNNLLVLGVIVVRIKYVNLSVNATNKQAANQKL